MLKRFFTFLAVCAISFMIAVPAFAETAISVTNEARGYTSNITFSDAVIEETTLNFYDWDTDAIAGREVYLITVNPATQITVNTVYDDKDVEGYTNGAFCSAYTFNTADNYYEYMVMQMILSGTVQENMDGVGNDFDPISVDYLSYIDGDGANGEQYYLQIKQDGAATPAAPVETPAETPVTETPAAPAATPATPTVQTPAAAGDAVAYTVQKWDTLGHISLNYYGSYKYHQAIYAANKEVFRQSKGQMKPGMVIYLPTTIAKGVNILTQPTAGEGEKLYTVKAGDTLGIIAANYYGNVNKYKNIFERNKDRIKNINMIYEGQIIVLPAK